MRRCTLIRVGVGFFQRVNGVNVITTPSELNAAAFESPGVAEEVVQQLKKLGTAGRLEFFGAFRRRSTMSSLAEVGLPAKEVTDAE